MEDDLANERIRPLHSIQISLLAGIIVYVHAFALCKIVAQKSRISGEPPPLACECGTRHSLLVYYMRAYTRRRDGPFL
jgi:hypothetical protein